MSDQKPESSRDRYIREHREDWYIMFPGGYIGDGVHVNDLDFGAEYDEIEAEREAGRTDADEP